MKLRGFFIIAVMASLSLQAQTPVEKDNGTIRTTASSLHKAGEELVVSISVEITRDLSSNESLVLVPVVTDSLEHRMELPPIYINSRKQQIIFMRETGRKEKEARSLQRKNGSQQSMHYLQSVPFEKWMNHATLSLIEKSFHLYRPSAPAAGTYSATRISHSASGSAENQNRERVCIHRLPCKRCDHTRNIQQQCNRTE